MPEYLAPGVYVEEISYHSKSIEGVSTSTAGFVGAACYGPIDLEPALITSLAEFERTYGGGSRLVFDGAESHNYLWHAARAFFEEGGKRLYVARAFRGYASAEGGVVGEAPPYARPGDAISDDEIKLNDDQLYTDGHARAWTPEGADAATSGDAFLVRARFPGAAGNLRVTLTLKLGHNVLGVSRRNPAKATAKSLREFDTVWIGNAVGATGSAPGGGFHVARYDKGGRAWRFTKNARKDDPAANTDLSLHAAVGLGRSTLSAARGDQVRVLTLTVTISSPDDMTTSVHENVALDPSHTDSPGAPDSFSSRFGQNPNDPAQAGTLPVVVLSGEGIDTGLELLTAITASGLNDGLLASLDDFGSGVPARAALSTDAARSVTLVLKGGGDGNRPTASEYEGRVDAVTNAKSGLKAFENLEDISVVAAPGSTAGYTREKTFADQSDATMRHLISHAELMRYRVALLDSGEGQTISDVRATRAGFDSSHAALYYPWVRVLDPVTNKEIDLPPSGFVAGLFARNDAERGVSKAPAGMTVRLATGFERGISKQEQDELNPVGVNCFRSFAGQGMKLWGARTISFDPEWRYITLRRYFAYLERSIDKGTQWVVFEPNGERLWNNVRTTITNFLIEEWKSGALLGSKPEEAFFVRCDRATMTQNDLDNGRLVCLIGVAALRPAEFNIFRIGQWTGDGKP